MFGEDQRGPLRASIREPRGVGHAAGRVAAPTVQAQAASDAQVLAARGGDKAPEGERPSGEASLGQIVLVVRGEEAVEIAEDAGPPDELAALVGANAAFFGWLAVMLFGRFPSADGLDGASGARLTGENRRGNDDRLYKRR